MKRSLLFIILTMLVLFSANAQLLSSKSRVSILTCNSGSELITTYGHSAIRVCDPEKGFDYVYNYGVFDFNAPNFFWNFVTGKPVYRLAIDEFRSFVFRYKHEGQSVGEQVLDLSLDQRQKVFEFLQINMLPENSNYTYDYFLNNCSTKVNDLFQTTLGDSLDLNIARENFANKGFRGMLEPHLQGGMQWAKFGMDFIFGYKNDNEASAEQTMFLPNNLAKVYASANVYNGGEWKPIVISERNYESNFMPYKSFCWCKSPLFVSWLLFAVVLILSFIGWVKGNQSWVFERVLWSLNLLMGLIIVSLWFFTQHIAFRYNFNLLWLSPLSVVFLFTGSGKIGVIVKKLQSFIILSMAILWWLLPQYFNAAAYPILLIFVVRIVKRIEGNFNHIKE